MGTPHDHREFVPGCFRCDLSRQEAPMDYFHGWGLESKTLCGEDQEIQVISGPTAPAHITCPRCCYVLENRCVEDGSTFDEHYDRGYADGMTQTHAPEQHSIEVAERDKPIGVSIGCTCGWTAQSLAKNETTAYFFYAQHIRELANGWIPDSWGVKL